MSQKPYFIPNLVFIMYKTTFLAFCEAPPMVKKFCIIIRIGRDRGRCKVSIAPWFSYVGVSITRTCKEQGNIGNNDNLMFISLISCFVLSVSTVCKWISAVPGGKSQETGMIRKPRKRETMESQREVFSALKNIFLHFE